MKGSSLPAPLYVNVKSNGPPCTDVLEAVFAGVGENKVIVLADIFALPDGTYQISGSFSLAGIYELRVRLLFQTATEEAVQQMVFLTFSNDQ